MGGFFGTISTFFSKLGSFTTYVTERLSATYEGLGGAQQFTVILAIIFVALLVVYMFVLLLRFSFKISTRKLKNVRREYQITLNRVEGKRCNFIWDILLYQKIVILDDPLLPKEEEQQVLLTA